MANTAEIKNIEIGGVSYPICDSTARTNASNASSTANTAKSNAATAKSTADSALSKANTNASSISSINTKLSNHDTAIVDAKKAGTDAQASINALKYSRCEYLSDTSTLKITNN